MKRTAAAFVLAACVLLSLAALPRPIPTGTTTKALRDEITLVLDPQIATLTASLTRVTTENNTLANTVVARDATIDFLTAERDAAALSLATLTQTLSVVQLELADCNAEALAFVPKQAALDAFQAWLTAQKTAQDALADVGVVVPE